jgi:hypothetical protein
MTQFLQIGEMAYNVDRIEIVNLNFDGKVVLFYTQDENDGGIALKGPEADAFRYWWENKAPVYVASVADPLPLDAPERSQPGHRARLFKGEGFGPDWAKLG